MNPPSQATVDLTSTEAHSTPAAAPTTTNPDPVVAAPTNADPSSAKEKGEENKNEETKAEGGKKKKSAASGNASSAVWDHFTRKKQNPIYAICSYCSKELCVPSRNGTSSLHNHLSRCKKYPYNKDKKQKMLIFQNQSSVQDTGDSNSAFVTWTFDQAMCRKFCARMIVLDELPFKTVEHDGFRDFLNMLQPQFQIPSRTTVTRDCLDIFWSEKESLRKYFAKTKQRVSLTTDIWSSCQNLSYMCLTAHFIDHEWTLHKKILNFCTIPGHSGETIGKYVEKHLLDWGIDKVLTITVDNATSNDTGVRYLKRRINAWKNSVLDSEHLHMRCCAHILNLIVKDGMKELDDSIARIRSAVKYVRSSPARLQRFKECVEQVKIESKSLVCLDVETRWNSTYLMLESAIKFQTAFEIMEEKDSKYRAELTFRNIPTETDWDFARCFLPFLKGFYASTVRMSGSLYVTSNSYFKEVFGIAVMIKKKMTSGDESMKKMAARMKKKFDKYWGNIENINMLLFIGPILDPRYKLSYVFFIVKASYEEEVAANLCAKINTTLDDLFQYYSNVVGTLSETINKSHATQESTMDVDDDHETFLDNEFMKELEETTQMDVKSELERYLGEQRESLDNKFELLDWWKRNEARFPVMAAMARDVLAMPASTVASESAFSTGGRILDVFRSSLTPTIVEALICSQNWLKSKSVPIDIEEKLAELEIFEADMKDVPPQSTSSFTVDD